MYNYLRKYERVYRSEGWIATSSGAEYQDEKILQNARVVVIEGKYHQMMQPNQKQRIQKYEIPEECE